MAKVRAKARNDLLTHVCVGNLWTGRSLESNVSTYEHTHENEVRDVVKDDHCNCTEDLETSQDSRRTINEHRDGTGCRKMDTKIAMDEQDPVEGMRGQGKFVAIALTDQKKKKYETSRTTLQHARV